MSFRAEADVRLVLEFQAIGEGVVSRGMRLFGSGGRCEAWYQVLEVVRQPPELGIAAGDKLRLSYRCGHNRQFISPRTDTIDWAAVGQRDYVAEVWLWRDHIERDRQGTWHIANPDNLLAPAASSKR